MKTSIICIAISIMVSGIAIGSVKKSNIAAKFSIANSVEDKIVEVKWLESTGTQFILFNSKVNGIDGWILPENDNGHAPSLGIWNGGARADGIKWTTFNNRGWIICNAAQNSTIYTFDMKYEFSQVIVNGTNAFVNGICYQMLYPLGRYFSQQPYFALFGAYNAKTSFVDCRPCKIGRLKLFYDDELLYDLIPIKFKNEDNSWEGAMYDVLNDSLLRNQGTGKFIVGPNK